MPIRLAIAIAVHFYPLKRAKVSDGCELLASILSVLKQQENRSPVFTELRLTR
jgi:hypothetical protein